MNTQKSEIRHNARAHLEKINPLEEQPDLVIDKFFDNVAIGDGAVIAAYWPLGYEFDPTGILEEAVKRGHRCALPIVEQGSKILSFREWLHGTKMKKAAYGIMEPQDTPAVIPDIILVPLLAFDRQGHRLGKGGGYYDATLEALRTQKEILAIGLGYAGQAVLFSLPREDHDQKLDAVLTPKDYIRF
jgi:5-formyltetrahydrofolate cyclo-ligase